MALRSRELVEQRPGQLPGLLGEVFLELAGVRNVVLDTKVQDPL